MSKPKCSSELKLQIVKEYLNGGGSYKSLATAFGVGRKLVEQWIRTYRVQGELGQHSRVTTFKDDLDLL